MTDDSSVTHVTDTAFWVAHFRAKESQRAAPTFHDPLAALLCGYRGRQIARSIPRATMVEWGMVVRTSAIDRLIYVALQSGIETILNLGAGLDTRPYRMQLPASLRWIEMDFPNIIEFKNAKLFEHRPICEVERVDNAGQRKSPREWTAKLGKAPFLFEVKDWFEFFERYGWRSSQMITSFEEAQRIGRPYPFDFPFGLLLRVLPKAMSQKIHSSSGAVLMQNVAPGVNKPFSRLENSHPASPSLTNGRAS
jgi:O-methyltransferase involved in polyketide biosynthesis